MGAGSKNNNHNNLLFSSQSTPQPVKILKWMLSNVQEDSGELQAIFF